MIVTKDSFTIVDYLGDPPEKEKLRSAAEFRDALMKRMFTPPEQREQALLPWQRTHDRIQFRPGEVTMWLGINGHGKSLVTSQAGLGFAEAGQRICVASFEMLPEATLERMAKQAIGRANPNPASVNAFMDWSDPRVVVYDQMGSVDRKELLCVMRYSAECLQVKHFFIDSMLKCGIDEKDFDAQKSFVEQLCTVARDYRLHVHLIHHSKKLDDEFMVPGKFDARGSGTIGDQVDQIITVFRNKKKERDPAADDEKGDAFLYVDKNRHSGWEGMIPLWFIPNIGVYCDTAERRMRTCPFPITVDALDYRAGRN